jgi:hypothetical protein
MRFISRVVVKEVDGHRDIILGVKQQRVGIFAFREAASVLCCLDLAIRQYKLVILQHAIPNNEDEQDAHIPAPLSPPHSSAQAEAQTRCRTRPRQQVRNAS